MKLQQNGEEETTVSPDVAVSNPVAAVQTTPRRSRRLVDYSSKRASVDTTSSSIDFQHIDTVSTLRRNSSASIDRSPPFHAVERGIQRHHSTSEVRFDMELMRSICENDRSTRCFDEFFRREDTRRTKSLSDLMTQGSMEESIRRRSALASLSKTRLCTKEKRRQSLSDLSLIRISEEDHVKDETVSFAVRVVVQGKKERMLCRSESLRKMRLQQDRINAYSIDTTSRHSTRELDSSMSSMNSSFSSISQND